MLEIDVSLEESYDETTEKFVSNGFRVTLEHSLVSMSKWESFWEKPFLGKETKSSEETISYVRMMIVGSEPPPEILRKLIETHLDKITSYIQAKMTATVVSETKNSPGYAETITSELIYYWMISMNIPVEFQYWHLNRLITLIRVINAKNAPKRKMSVQERRSLNRKRLAQYNTRG